MKKLVFVFLAIIIIAGCESKSGRRTASVSQQFTGITTKVVIIDSRPNYYSTGYTYKVKVIDTRTVGYVVSNFLYEKDDTIMSDKRQIKY